MPLSPSLPSWLVLFLQRLLQRCSCAFGAFWRGLRSVYSLATRALVKLYTYCFLSSRELTLYERRYPCGGPSPLSVPIRDTPIVGTIAQRFTTP